MAPRTLPLLAAVAPNSIRPGSAAAPAPLDSALAALTTYQVGSGRGSLLAIDEAVVASLDNAPACQDLEQRFVALLKSDLSTVAKEYICGKLALIGSAQCVAVLAQLLEHKQLGEPARAALVSIRGEQARAALRDAIPRLKGPAKVGVLTSLGTYRDPADIAILVSMLQNPDHQIISAAAAALGEIGTADAAEALAKGPAAVSDSVQLVVLNSRLACAERLLEAGSKAEALAIYKALASAKHPKQIQLAAKRGLLSVVQQK